MPGGAFESIDDCDACGERMLRVTESRDQRRANTSRMTQSSTRSKSCTDRDGHHGRTSNDRSDTPAVHVGLDARQSVSIF